MPFRKSPLIDFISVGQMAQNYPENRATWMHTYWPRNPFSSSWVTRNGMIAAQKIVVSRSSGSGFVNPHGFGCRQNGGMRADIDCLAQPRRQRGRKPYPLRSSLPKTTWQSFSPLLFPRASMPIRRDRP